MLKTIIDISHHQLPSKINYDVLARQVDWVIIRTQYGSNLVDRHYKTHHEAFQQRGVPTAAYAWVRGVSINDMKVEARDFYNRTKKFQPTFWFVDAEEKSMGNMRKGISAYIAELRRLGAKKVGIYVGHHLYKSFRLNMGEADAIWIPRYGKNDGTVNSKPLYPCDIHQYTDKGTLKGYNGPLDLNRIISSKSFSYFTDGKQQPSKEKKYNVEKVVGAYRTAQDAKKRVNRVGSVKKGEYYIFNESVGMVNVTKTKGAAGSWINPTTKESAMYYTVKSGDTFSEIAVKQGVSMSHLRTLNPQVKNIDRIYVGDKIRIR